MSRLSISLTLIIMSMSFVHCYVAPPLERRSWQRQEGNTKQRSFRVLESVCILLIDRNLSMMCTRYVQLQMNLLGASVRMDTKR